MRNISAAILGSVIGAFITVAGLVCWFGWGLPTAEQPTHVDPTRADYIDLLLTIATLFLGALGIAVTVGALVVGVVAFKTLREIKDEAASDAKNTAEDTINETMDQRLEPSIKAKLQESLPNALRDVLQSREGHKALIKLAREGVFDQPLERATANLQGGFSISDHDENEQT